MNKYEATIIFRDSLQETEWDEAVESVRKEIERQDGTFGSCTRLGRREFARAMQKQSGGHYALISFELGGDKISPLLARLKLNDVVFRVQIVRATDAPIPESVLKAPAPVEETEED